MKISRRKLRQIIRESFGIQGASDNIAIHLSNLGWDENAIRAHYEMDPPFVEIRHIISNLDKYESPKDTELVPSSELFVDAESMSEREQRYLDYKAAKASGKKAMYFRDTYEDPDDMDFARVAPITVFENDEGLLEVADGMHRVFLAKKSNAALHAWVIRLKRDSLREQDSRLETEKPMRKLIRKSILQEIFKNPSAYPFREDQVFGFVGSSPQSQARFLFSGRDGAEYYVEIEWSDSKDMWKISFDVVGGNFAYTGKNDFKVLGTVITIVKHFTEETLPNHPNLDDYFRNQNRFVIKPEGQFRDMKRAELFQAILKKQGVNSELAGHPLFGIYIFFEV